MVAQKHRAHSIGSRTQSLEQYRLFFQALVFASFRETFFLHLASEVDPIAGPTSPSVIPFEELLRKNPKKTPLRRAPSGISPSPSFRGFLLERFFVYFGYYRSGVRSRLCLHRALSPRACLCVFVYLLILHCVYIVRCLYGLNLLCCIFAFATHALTSTSCSC